MDPYRRLIENLTRSDATDNQVTAVEDIPVWSVSADTLLLLEMDTRANRRVAECAEAIRRSKVRSETYQLSLLGNGAFSLEAVRNYRDTN